MRLSKMSTKYKNIMVNKDGTAYFMIMENNIKRYYRGYTNEDDAKENYDRLQEEKRGRIAAKLLCENLARGIIVSPEDIHLLSKHAFLRNVHGYFHCHMKIDGKWKGARLHKMIMSEAGRVVDHINRNKADNRRENLRYTDYTVSNFNMSKKGNNTSGHVGVSLHKQTGKYEAYLSVYGERVFHKLYTYKQDAINARKQAEQEYAKELGLCVS